MNTTPEQALIRLIEILDRLEIRYMVGGSTASGIHGLPRTTRDVDLVAHIHEEDIEPFAELVKGDFYVDADQIRVALEHRRSFNIIHFKTAYKFDIFPLPSDPYCQVQFSRRRYENTSFFGSPLEICVASPEDVILSKLRWYSMGGKTSEQQWNDVLGVLAVQAERLDLTYLREWAAYLGMGELLEEALTERHEPFS